MNNFLRGAGKSPGQEEIQEAAQVLARLNPGFLPKEIFEEVTRLCATPILELVPLRKNENSGQVEVLLLKRSANDPVWPGQLHTPGTVVRATDVGDALEVPLERLYGSELQLQASADPVFVEIKLHKVARGTELATIMYVDLSNKDVSVGTWYPSNFLPENLVTTQRDFIIKAVNIFQGSTS